MPEEVRYVVTLNEDKYWTFAVANGKKRGGWLARDKDLAVCLQIAAEKIGGPVDKPLGLDALAIANLKTAHEFIIAAANLSSNGEQVMLRKLTWRLAQGGKGKFERIRLLKEALNAASFTT